MSKLVGDPGYRAGWCIHYRGIGRFNSCEAGVVYDETFRSARWPCFMEKDTGLPKPDADLCSQLRPPTKEEIAAHEVWQRARFDRLISVMEVVKPWRKKHKGRSFEEIIECPACKGRLHLSIAAVNGHVHGHCETKGCVSWME